jgi:hypothetical protein
MVVSSLRLTLSELPLVETEVLRPCLVWFPTGPGYDRHLTKALPGFKTEDLAPDPSSSNGVAEDAKAGGDSLRESQHR